MLNIEETKGCINTEWLHETQYKQIYRETQMTRVINRWLA